MNLLLTLVLKSTGIFLLAFVCLFFGRNRAAHIKHWIISLSFLGLLILPIIDLSISPYQLKVNIGTNRTEVDFFQEDWDKQKMKRAENTPSSYPHNDVVASDDVILHNVSPPFISQPSTPSSLKADSEHWPSSSFSTSQFDISPSTIGYFFQDVLSDLFSSRNVRIMGVVWLVGMFILILRLCIGMIEIFQLTRKGQPLPFVQKDGKFNEVRIICHPAVKVPMTWSFRQHYILLPESAREWSASTLQTVLLHEWAHIERKDFWIQVLSMLCVSVYWFHPLVWWLQKRQIQEREKACDARVLSKGVNKAYYAQQLVQVARHLKASSQVHYAIPMAQASFIKQRILSILSFQGNLAHFSRRRRFAFGLVGVMILCLLTAFSVVIDGEEDMGANELSLSFSSLVGERVEGRTEVENGERIEKAEDQLLEHTLKKIPAMLSLGMKADELELLNWTNHVNVDSVSASYSSPANHSKAISDLMGNPSSAVSFDATSGIWNKAQYVHWNSSKSEFHVYIVGQHRDFPVFPYFEVVSPDDMIIIQERRRGIFGEKNYTLAITRAPYEGILVQSFFGRNAIQSYSGGYQEGDPLYLFTVDGDWDFLAREQRKWMRRNMRTIWKKLVGELTLPVDWERVDQDHPVLQTHRLLKQERFLSDEDIRIKEAVETVFQWGSIRPGFGDELEGLKRFSLSSLPLAEPYREEINRSGNSKQVGNTRIIWNNIGGSGWEKGDQFGRVFRNIPPGSILSQFQFHLDENENESLSFDLHLYQVEENVITKRITNQPIPIDASDRSGWITVDLSSQKIVLAKDVLAILALGDRERDSNDTEFYLSFAPGDYQFIHQSTQSWWGFFEGNYAWNMTVESLNSNGRDDQASVLREDVPLADSFSNVPERKGIITEVGRKEITQVTTGGTMGGDYINTGKRFGSVIKAIPQGAQLKDFNFHLRFNDYGQITFNLYLFKVEDNEIGTALRREPIQFTVSNKSSWLSVDLENYQLAVEGDLLAVLELEELKGKRKNGRLFFTHAFFSHEDESYLPLQRDKGNGWAEFTEAGFAFYVTVEH